MLDEQYRPLGAEGTADPRPPLYPTRLRALIYAFGEQAFKDDAQLAGAKMRTRAG